MLKHQKGGSRHQASAKTPLRQLQYQVHSSSWHNSAKEASTVCLAVYQLTSSKDSVQGKLKMCNITAAVWSCTPTACETGCKRCKALITCCVCKIALRTGEESFAQYKAHGQGSNASPLSDRGQESTLGRMLASSANCPPWTIARLSPGHMLSDCRACARNRLSRMPHHCCCAK